MKPNNNSKLVALASVGLSIAVIMGAFAVVWLTPRDALPAAAQDAATTAKTTQITVRGTGSISAKPDTLIMNVGVAMQDSTVKVAQARVTSVADDMLSKLKAAGIDEKDYRTVQYGVEPVMDYGNGNDKGGGPGTPKLTGFRVTNMFEITLRAPARAPDLLDALVSAGANTIYNVSYTFADADSLAKQAYDKAVKDAADRAGRLATLSNVKLGNLVSVTEASANTPGPVYDKSMGMGGGGAAGFVPGQQTVQVDLIVTYEAALWPSKASSAASGHLSGLEVSKQITPPPRV